MAGRFRTGSSPSRTVMSFAVYVAANLLLLAALLPAVQMRQIIIQRNRECNKVSKTVSINGQIAVAIYNGIHYNLS